MTQKKIQHTLTEDDAFEIGVEAWTYLFPLVLMELTRRVMTNVTAPESLTLRSPMGTFAHGTQFPDASFKDVVRPNVDTLYSMLWFDVGAEPLIVSTPECEQRYHVLPLMDMWTDVFASVGTHSTGGAGGDFAIIGPRWKGPLPKGVQALRSPTDVGWILGRVQANGEANFEAVRDVQRRIQSTPLSGFGKPATGSRGRVDPAVDMVTPPIVQAESLPAADFFALAAQLMKRNPPHASDGSMLFRLARLGLVAGEDFDLAGAPSVVQATLTPAMAEARTRMLERGMTRRLHRDGWVLPAVLGVYGNEYLSRALTAYRGLGALPPTEALYPTALADAQGRPLHGSQRYQLRFAAGMLPPAGAFWSVTIYGEDHFLVANPLNRFAIGNRDALKFNPDGSLVIYIQHEPPGGELDANWLPSPKGAFTLQLRVYAPQSQALDGRWNASAVQRVS
ncbi:DUF1254 domain-containing protein [Ottowia sp. VDI28]|uniref:DUF1254 domain-containing protein n=1 Tax=Ottowia sp. VDI28 TaxID=3133968 RepID=UPI003C2CA840